MAEGAVRVVLIGSERYREMLRDEVGRTTGDPSGVDDEIADLLAALGRADGFPVTLAGFFFSQG